MALLENCFRTNFLLFGHAVIFSLIYRKENKANKIEEEVFPQNEDANPVSALVGIGGILLVLFIIAAAMKGGNSTTSNSNSSTSYISNTANCPKFASDYTNGINLQPSNL